MSLQFLHGVDTIEVNDETRVIRTAKSSVIGIVGTAGQGPINTATLLTGSTRAATSTFGPLRDNGFTIPQALDSFFKQGDNSGATVVVINVCDPAVHNADEVDDVVTFGVGNTAKLSRQHISMVALDAAISGPVTATVAGALPTLPVGCTDIVLTTVAGAPVLAAAVVLGGKYILSYSATLIEGADFTVDVSNGVLTRPVDGSSIIPKATVSASYTYVDASAVTESDIIGMVDELGNTSGIKALYGAKAKVFVQPRILLAPKFTGTKPTLVTRNAVVTELEVAALKLGGIYCADCPDTSKEAAVAHRSDFGGLGYFHYPDFLTLSPEGDGTYTTLLASVILAGVMAAVDRSATEGFHVSPSNHTINGVLGLTKDVDFNINDSETAANYLNANFVATSIHVDNFLLWGNRLANGEFINRRRTAQMVNESILYAHLWAVDRNIGKGYVEQVVNGVKEYLRQLKNREVILGGTAWADKEINTPSVIGNGELFIDYDFGGPTPAEHIHFRAHLTDKYVAAIFDI